MKKSTMANRLKGGYVHDYDSMHNSAGQSSASSDSCEPYIFVDKMRETACLQGFRDLYESQQMFDITLTVDNHEFGCHRAMLASSSDYFRAMFTSDLAERDQKTVTINGVKSVAMEQILKYLYTGQSQFESDNVQHILSAANLFQLEELRNGCANYMALKLDVDNCINIHFFAQAHECECLEFQAWDLITEHFDQVSKNTEFLDLNVQSLVDIIQFDDLQVREENVYEAVLRWLNHNVEGRSEHIYRVFQHVRFALMDVHYFYDKVRDYKLFHSDQELQKIFDEVIRYKLLSSRWSQIDLRFEPRYGADFCRVVVYTSYFDDEKKQVLQLYGQRSEEATTHSGCILCDLPSDMENPTMLVTGENDLYIAGGDGAGDAVYRWSSEENMFEEVQSMDTERKQFTLVQVDRSIYALGGCNTSEGNLATVLKYSEQYDDWEQVAPMPKPLRCHCATSYHGKLYVFGGEVEKLNKTVTRGKKELSKNVFCYNPEEGKWCRLADMKIPRALAGCIVFRDRIYVIGGFGTITDSWIKDKSPENSLSSVEIYDPQTNSWEMGPELPVPLCAMGVVKYYGTIYILGGENKDVSSNVYLFNSRDGCWQHKDEMVAGVTETSIHSVYAIINITIDLD